ncbi:MAG: carboxymuconolactone decarboxylase family protein [Planctomycetota bacterium]
MALTDRDRCLLRLSAAICLGRWDVVAALRRSAPAPPDRSWREAVLQAHLFAGFPRVVEAWRVLGAAGGLGTPSAAETEGAETEDLAAGDSLFAAIYAENAPAVGQELALYHPALARWIRGHAYGRVLTRGGLSPAERELLGVACLAALDQERQLAAHARGAIRCGADPEDLAGALLAVGDLLAPKRLAALLAIVARR